MYFNKFPPILYPFEINGELVYRQVTDVTVNVRIRRAILDYITLYDEYDIGEGETPEIVSEKAYGSPYYHWAIMMLNERYDYVNDWPLAQYELEQHMRVKYGEPVTFTVLQDVKNSTTVNAIADAPITVFTEFDYKEFYNGATTHVTVTEVTDVTETIVAGVTKYNCTFTVDKTIHLLREGSNFVVDPLYNVHHYVDSEGFIVSSDNTNLVTDEFDAYPVSNYDYEVQANEAKRRIKLLSNENLFKLLAQFKNLV